TSYPPIGGCQYDTRLSGADVWVGSFASIWHRPLVRLSPHSGHLGREVHSTRSAGTDINVATMYPHRCHETVRHWEESNETNQPQSHARDGRHDGDHGSFCRGMSGGAAPASQRPASVHGLRPGQTAASYDQVYYEPLIARVSQLLHSNSD